MDFVSTTISKEFQLKCIFFLATLAHGGLKMLELAQCKNYAIFLALLQTRSVFGD